MEPFRLTPEWIRWHPEPLQARAEGIRLTRDFAPFSLNLSPWLTVEAPRWSLFSDLQVIPGATTCKQSGAFTVKLSWKGSPRQVNSRFT